MKKFTYDPEADAIGIYFTPDGATYAESEEIAPGVSLDYDTEGRVIGVEILGVRGIVSDHKAQERRKMDVKPNT